MLTRIALAVSVLSLAACQSMTPTAQAPAAQPTAAPSQAAAAPAAPAWQQGRSGEYGQLHARAAARQADCDAGSGHPARQLQAAARLQGRGLGHRHPGRRAMVRGDDGKIYVGTRGIGRVYEVTDAGSQRTSRVVVDKLVQPAGVAYRNGSLYVIAIDKVLRFDGIAKNPNVQPVDMTAAFKLPKEQHHNWKYIAFGPDGKLYVPFGAPCNICEPGSEYAQIRRYNADGSGMEVIATGVRNTQGFDWHPVTKEMWFTDHGRDWMGDDMPEDELNRMTTAAARTSASRTATRKASRTRISRRPNACNGVTLPVQTMGPHAAAMGVLFYTGNMFPAEYQNTLFVARKGSWNRTQQVRLRRRDGAHRCPGQQSEDRAVHDRLRSIRRPTPSPAVRPTCCSMPDGSLLISDEQLGAIYRISYAR